MANNTKTMKFGNYICKVGNFDIYMKCSFKEDHAGRKSVTSHQHCVYFAKKLVQGGFKTKEEAVEHAMTIAADFKSPKKSKK